MALRIFCFIVLVTLALAVLRPEIAQMLAGLQPLGEPSVEELDSLTKFDDHTAKPFFDDRNQLEVTVPRTMEAKEFLSLYLIDQVHIRNEIAQQEGWQEIADKTMLQEGRTYKITLTPPAPDDL
jgi:hypothetical protein